MSHLCFAIIALGFIFGPIPGVALCPAPEFASGEPGAGQAYPRLPYAKLSALSQYPELIPNETKTSFCSFHFLFPLRDGAGYAHRLLWGLLHPVFFANAPPLRVEP